MSDATDSRPKWSHDTPEALARWLVSNFVTKITHHWRMTGPDTSEDWIELHSEKEKRRVNTYFFSDNHDFSFSPYHAGLVQVRNKYPESVRQTIDKIDLWEKANARDRADFERLKKKFG